MISEILDIAELQVGFKPNDSSLAVEAVASVNGKFILTITKISSESTINSKLVSHVTSITGVSPYIFEFNTLDDFCDFCSYININTNNKYIDLLDKSSLILLDNNYYLIIDKHFLDIPTYKAFNLFISEFADFIRNEVFFENRLREFGKVVF